MDLQKHLHDLENCPCGKKHTFATKVCEIDSGLVHKVGDILDASNFPKYILLVADDSTLKASEGILESLAKNNYKVKKFIYTDMKTARVEELNEIKAIATDVDAILSVGSGSLNDLCRVAAFHLGKRFAIFATAPSMDGFASDTAPIIENNFKSSWKAEQPEIIIADTKILANAPCELKAAGFGDIIAKYIALVDWKLANMLIDEYYCEKIVGLTQQAIDSVVSIADEVTKVDENAAKQVMEALVFTGLAMKLAGSSRPASGAEHVISHFWECKKLIKGIWPDYHGKKTGVATVLCNSVYRQIAEENETIEPTTDNTDWDKVREVYGPELVEEMMKMNQPTITDSIDPKKIKELWPEIRNLILTTLPTDEELVSIMKRAGAPVNPSEINVDEKLLVEGFHYHSYMRYRLILTRLFPILNVKIPDVRLIKN